MNGTWSRRTRNFAAVAALSLVGATAAFGQVVYLENFESPTPNFSSDHQYFAPPSPGNTYGVTPLWNTRTFTVDTNPFNWHEYWTKYGDHTTGTGKMMIVNAATTSTQENPTNCNVNVFRSPSFAVTKNTVYELSYWVALSIGYAPPLLQVSVNDVALTPSFDAAVIGASAGTWHQVKYLWNSGTATTASLSLCDERTVFDGDDYALDDISVAAKGAEQWCSPGYWRQPQHEDSWAATGLEPSDLYSEVFDGAVPPVSRKARACSDPVKVPANPTLMQVLTNPQCYGGDAFNLVADALSDAHPDINYAGNRVPNACPLN